MYELKIRVPKFDTNHASVQKLPDSAVKSVSTARHWQEQMCQAKRSAYRSVLRLDVDILHVMHIKDKQILVSDFLFDVLWPGRGSSVSYVAFLRSRDWEAWNYMNPVHAIPCLRSVICYLTILVYVLHVVSSWRFPNQIPVRISLLHAWRSPSISSSLTDRPHNIWWGGNISKLIMRF